MPKLPSIYSQNCTLIHVIACCSLACPVDGWHSWQITVYVQIFEGHNFRG